MKRLAPLLCATALVASLVQPAHAMGPLASIVVAYVKQAIKEKVVGYARQELAGALSERMGNVPGSGLLAGAVPGARAAQRAPTLPPEAMESLRAAGLLDTNPKPLTEQDWQDYGRIVGKMAAGAGGDAPDIRQMREMVAASPQLAGLVRAQLGQFRDIEDEQARMRDAYEKMGDGERQEVVAELVKALRDVPEEDREQARSAMDSEALGLPEDLKRRLAAALPQ